MLHKMKVRTDSDCTYCTGVLDVIEHFFFECPVVAIFWKYIENYILIHFNVQIKLHVQNVLFGITNPSIKNMNVRQLNHVLLIGKMCISIFKKTNSRISIKDIFENNMRFRFKYFANEN